MGDELRKYLQHLVGGNGNFLPDPSEKPEGMNAFIAQDAGTRTFGEDSSPRRLG